MYEDQEVVFEGEDGNVVENADEYDDEDEEDYANDADDDDGYDVNDPRTRGHTAYKISQENAARATRRFKYGDDVDEDGENYYSREEDNENSLEQRLENAEEARGWAFDEATRRYEWNAMWTGGAHDNVEEEADKRMDDVEKWNNEIEGLKGKIAHRASASVPTLDSDSDSDAGSNSDSNSSSDSDEYEKNVLDAREAREGGYEDDEQEERDNEEDFERFDSDSNDDEEYEGDD